MNFIKLSLLSGALLAGSMQLQAMEAKPKTIKDLSESDLEKYQEAMVNNLKNVPQYMVTFQQALLEELAKDPRTKHKPFGLVADKQTMKDAIEKVLQTPVGKSCAMLMMMNQAKKTPTDKS